MAATSERRASHRSRHVSPHRALTFSVKMLMSHKICFGFCFVFFFYKTPLVVWGEQSFFWFERFISACSPENKWLPCPVGGCEMWRVCVLESGSESTLVLAKCHSLITAFIFSFLSDAQHSFQPFSPGNTEIFNLMFLRFFFFCSRSWLLNVQKGHFKSVSN